MATRSTRSRRARRAGMTTVEFVIALCLVGAVAVGMWRSFGDDVRKRGAQADTLINDHLRISSKARE